MKIGFYSNTPLEDKKNWSGTMFKMYEQLLEQNYIVERIPKQYLNALDNRKLKDIGRIYSKIFKRTYNYNVNIFSSKKIAKKINNYLKDKKFDILFVPAHINDFAYVKTKIPIIYLNDANTAQLFNYYPYYLGVGLLSKIETKFIEKKALNKFKEIIFSSEWAADFAINHYKISRNKVNILKFGANIEVPSNKEFLTKEPNDVIQFLFLGVDWYRKGGEIALQTIEKLVDMGYNAKLKVVGCIPPRSSKVLEVIPFLNKNIDNEYNQLKAILFDSNFLFVPTKAECYGIVFCEASAYGLPSITTDTGGITTIVKNGLNGYTLPINSSVNDYVKIIEPLITNKEKLKLLKISSRKRYEEELNWEKWGNDFNNVINKLKL